MKKIFSLLLLMIFVFTSLIAQTDTLSFNINESRNKNIRHQLDYRFKGGSGSFERVFFANVEYTKEALSACVVGTVILSFTVDCNNNLGDFRMRNPMHYGLNEKLQEFYKATEGQWNSCTDEKYARFEIPILFTVEGTQTEASGFIVLEGKASGIKCKSDAYYLEAYEKHKSKGKTKRALDALDVLIRRDPYNLHYYDLKKELLTE
jgi:hypothetical protein